ncbi:MAG: hypothetical protein RIR70_1487, partial [Pseudomonadota bacterium]
MSLQSITLRTGPLVCRIHSNLPEIWQAIATLYE